MNVSVQLTVECGDSSTAEKLFSVLSPDNRAFPKDQLFTSELDGPKLLFRVESDRVLSVISTIESILSDAALFQEVWMLSS